MNLTIDNNIIDNDINDSFNQNFDNTSQHSIHSLPKELIVKIFGHLNLATLGTICSVNQRWRELANEPTNDLWKMVIYRTIAFGNDKWAQCFGKDVIKCEDSGEEFSSLPWQEFIEDCKNFKSVFLEKNAQDCLMLVRLPQTLNGGLTLNNLGELAKRYFSSSSCFSSINPDIIHELGNKSIDESRWVFMTKNILPGSKNKSYVEQHQMVVYQLAQQALINYKIPETLEAVVCILAQYFDSNTCLFSNDPEIYTHCQEKVKMLNTVVGRFSPDGLKVDTHTNYEEKYTGVAAVRKF